MGAWGVGLRVAAFAIALPLAACATSFNEPINVQVASGPGKAIAAALPPYRRWAAILWWRSPSPVVERARPRLRTACHARARSHANRERGQHFRQGRVRAGRIERGYDGRRLRQEQTPGMARQVPVPLPAGSKR
jgi:hypothetical protein